MPADKMIEVWNYPRIPLAEVDKYRLHEHGIEAEIFGGKVDSYYLTAIGGVSLMVREADLAAAKSILASNEEVQEEIVAEQDEISDGKTYCSQCHSHAIRTKKIRHLKTGFFLADLLKARFGYKTVMGCRNCGRIWKNR
ncbi:MAG: DUF2007 domain-containing protein [Fibrobacteria bacterium]